MLSINKLLSLLVSIILSISLISVVLIYYSPADFNTYAMSSKLSSEDALKIFNYIEFGSFFIISVIPNLFYINSDIYLVLLSFFLLMYLVSSVKSFYSKISLIFLMAGFYGENLLLSQYKMLLATCFIVFAYRYSMKKPKNNLFPLINFIFHSQAVLYTLAYYISLKKCLIYSLVIGFFSIYILFYGSVYFEKFYVTSKIMTYTMTDGDNLSNFTLIKIVFFSFISLFLIDDKENYYYKCYVICVVFCLSFLSFPVVSGRIASMAVILEPFIIDKYKNKLYRKIFLFYCIFITVARYVQ